VAGDADGDVAGFGVGACANKTPSPETSKNAQPIATTPRPNRFQDRDRMMFDSRVPSIEQPEGAIKVDPPKVRGSCRSPRSGLDSRVVKPSFTTEDAMKPVRLVQSIALVAAIPVLASSARAATACKAEVRATPGSDQLSDRYLTKVFAVEIDTEAPCAKVYVDAVVTEQLFNGEEITTTHRGYRDVSNSPSTYKVNLRIARDSKLTDWKFTVNRCVVCGTE
jgi:hypothetical protein